MAGKDVVTAGGDTSLQNLWSQEGHGTEEVCYVRPYRSGNAQLRGSSFTWASMCMMSLTPSLTQLLALGPKWGSGATHLEWEVFMVLFP